MTLSNALDSGNIPQRIEIAHVEGIGWFVVKQDDINMLRTYSRQGYDRITAICKAVQMSLSTGWALAIETV